MYVRSDRVVEEAHMQAGVISTCCLWTIFSLYQRKWAGYGEVVKNYILNMWLLNRKLLWSTQVR